MMMHRSGRVLLILIVVTLLVVAARAWTGPRQLLRLGTAEAQQGKDTRQRLLLPPAARDKVLAEMRLMLESINGILQGVATGDITAAEKAARASGMTTAADVDPQIKQRLPEAFLALGMQTHKAFDALADQLKDSGTQESAIKGLARITANCVACHAAYRLDEIR
jgi:hypothetical protein